MIKFIPRHKVTDFNGEPMYAFLAEDKYCRVMAVERLIAESDIYCLTYAQYTIKDRWPTCEKMIFNKPQLAFHYAFYIMKSPWPECEKYLDDTYLDMYLEDWPNRKCCRS